MSRVETLFSKGHFQMKPKKVPIRIQECPPVVKTPCSSRISARHTRLSQRVAKRRSEKTGRDRIPERKSRCVSKRSCERRCRRCRQGARPPRHGKAQGPSGPRGRRRRRQRQHETTNRRTHRPQARRRAVALPRVSCAAVERKKQKRQDVEKRRRIFFSKSRSLSLIFLPTSLSLAQEGAVFSASRASLPGPQRHGGGRASRRRKNRLGQRPTTRLAIEDSTFGF